MAVQPLLKFAASQERYSFEYPAGWDVSTGGIGGYCLEFNADVGACERISMLT